MRMFKIGQLVKVDTRKYDGWEGGVYKILDMDAYHAYVAVVRGKQPRGNLLRLTALMSAETTWEDFKEYLDTGRGDERALIEFCTGFRA